MLSESEDLILIAREYDFFVDGYQVIRKEDIDEIGPTNSSEYTYKLLSREGLLMGIEPPVNDISGWHSVFAKLGVGEFILMEDEVADDMMIGPITKVDSQSVSLRFFDGMGQWRDECSMNYSDITSVQIKTNYIRVHQKYIDSV